MPRYEDYNPEIPETHDENEDFSHAQPEAPVRKRRRAAQAKAAPEKKQRPAAPKKRKEITQSADWMVKINDFFHSPTLRILVGILVVFVAAYFVIAYISFLKDGFADQTNVDNTPIGATQVRNLAGEGGARISQLLINDCFGLGSIVIIFWLAMIGLKLLGGDNFLKFKTLNFTIKCFVALITVSLIVGLVTIGMDSHVAWGGYHGQFVNEWIKNFFGWVGAALLSAFMLIAFIAICLRDLVLWVLRKKRAYDARKRHEAEIREMELARIREMEEMVIRERTDEIRAGESIDNSPEEEKAEGDVMLTDESDALNRDDLSETDVDSKEIENAEEATEQLSSDTTGAETPQEQEDIGEAETDTHPSGMKVRLNQIGAAVSAADSPQVFDPRDELPNYKFPPYALLAGGQKTVSINEDEQLANEGKITTTLRDLGIPIKSIEATAGPTITLYEIVPEDGVKIARIRGLADDIAMRLKASGVRIIAPVPGRGTVGIEVANKNPQTVHMRTILTSKRYQETKYELPIAIGSTISNEVYIADLAKMPHLLVAGATGQGKSVGLNAIIVSLLYSKHPAELKFVLIDPKKVELSLYNGLERHYLAKLPGEEHAIITDLKKTVPVLTSLCVEMDERYRLLMDAGGVRNIKEYNEKYINNRLPEGGNHRFLPYIVLVVDEFADLMVREGKEVEKPIIRLAQMARAVGIHLIIATQRPDVSVITGLIKANFPARIAFKTSSTFDSKTILNSTAAEKLVGRGDMLISNNGPIERVQCAFCDTKEVENVVAFISQQPGEPSAYILPEPVNPEEENGIAGPNIGDRDVLFNEVARRVVLSGIGSTSNIQRNFSIGYNRAGKIMDQLEAAGIVGPATGGKPRQVLVGPEELERILNS